MVEMMDVWMALSSASQRAALMVVSWVQMMEAMMSGPKAMEMAVRLKMADFNG